MLVALKNKLVSSVPFFNRLYKKYRIRKKRKEYSGLTNEQIFTHIYTNNKWDVNKENKEGFYSGPGSYGEVAKKYVAFVNDFIQEHQINSLTDVGCGDFAIGQQIIQNNSALLYNGCDVVKPVVDKNRQLYGSERVKFFHLDAANDEIPPADLLTIREVLQHLSNADIRNILSKTKAFKYVIITEHLLLEGTERSYNKDKPSGPDIRMVEDSGVYIDKPPFGLYATEVLRCRKDGFNKEAYVRSFLIDNSRNHE